MTETHTTFGNRIIIRMQEMPCHTPHDILKSPLVPRVVQRFLAHLAKHDSPLLGAAQSLSPEPLEHGISPAAEAVTEVLRLLVDFRPPVIREMVPHLAPLVSQMQPLADFVDKLYDFWRDYERFLIYEGAMDASRDRAVEGHLPFVRANDDLRNLVLEAYRRIDSNLRGYWPRVYHQVPAGASIGLLVDTIDWPCPYPALAAVPFVRLALLELPVVLYPHGTARPLEIATAATNPLAGAALEPAQWYCLPLRVGALRLHVFFHEDFLGLGASLVNLFEIADHADARLAPDALLLYGLPDAPTTLYEDAMHDLLVGTVGHAAETDAFETLEAMILAMHNALIRRRGGLPVAGAMARIALKNGTVANVVLAGAGAADTLEAFRVQAHEFLRDMTVIFDKMGSLEPADGRFIARGTAIGACARPDALQPGFALGQIDRSIYLNPLTADARVVIPITTHESIVAGYPVDLYLCATDDAAGPLYTPLAAPDAALQPLAAAGIRLGCLRMTDPDAAARALFALITG